jgi:hypothetical protein
MSTPSAGSGGGSCRCCAPSPIRAFLHRFRPIVLIGEDLVQVLSISHMLYGPMMLHVPSMAGHSVLNC